MESEPQRRRKKPLQIYGQRRDAEIHHSGTPRSVEQEEIERTRDMIGIGSWFSFGKDEFVHEYTSTYWFSIDGTDCKVTKVCGDYLALLRRMVADFEAPNRSQ